MRDRGLKVATIAFSSVDTALRASAVTPLAHLLCVGFILSQLDGVEPHAARAGLLAPLAPHRMHAPHIRLAPQLYRVCHKPYGVRTVRRRRVPSIHCTPAATPTKEAVESCSTLKLPGNGRSCAEPRLGEMHEAFACPVSALAVRLLVDAPARVEQLARRTPRNQQPLCACTRHKACRLVPFHAPRARWIIVRDEEAVGTRLCRRQVLSDVAEVFDPIDSVDEAKTIQPKRQATMPAVGEPTQCPRVQDACGGAEHITHATLARLSRERECEHLGELGLEHRQGVLRLRLGVCLRHGGDGRLLIGQLRPVIEEDLCDRIHVVAVVVLEIVDQHLKLLILALVVEAFCLVEEARLARGRLRLLGKLDARLNLELLRLVVDAREDLGLEAKERSGRRDGRAHDGAVRPAEGAIESRLLLGVEGGDDAGGRAVVD